MRYENSRWFVTPSMNMRDIPTTPIAPEGGLPVDPGFGVPSLPIAPGDGLPIPDFGFPDVPVPPIAPEGGRPVPPGPSREPCRVRVLHAAVGTPPVRVTVGGVTITDTLSYGNVSEYQEVPDGFRGVTVAFSRSPRSVLLRVNLPFRAGGVVTLSVVRARGSLSVMQVYDGACRRFPQDTACLRCVNLSPDSPPLDVSLHGGTPIYRDVRFKEVTPYRLARPDSYMLYVSLTPTAADSGIETAEGVAEPEVLVSFAYDANSGAVTTAYFIGLVGSQEEPFTVLQLQDR